MISTFLQRNSVYVGSIFFGAFAFSIGYDKVTSAIFDAHNRGKSWADVKGKYVEASAEE